jgi:hypothetical protein
MRKTTESGQQGSRPVATLFETLRAPLQYLLLNLTIWRLECLLEAVLRPIYIEARGRKRRKCYHMQQTITQQQ